MFYINKFRVSIIRKGVQKMKKEDLFTVLNIKSTDQNNKIEYELESAFLQIVLDDQSAQVIEKKYTLDEIKELTRCAIILNQEIVNFKIYVQLANRDLTLANRKEYRDWLDLRHQLRTEEDSFWKELAIAEFDLVSYNTSQTSTIDQDGIEEAVKLYFVEKGNQEYVFSGYQTLPNVYFLNINKTEMSCNLKEIGSINQVIDFLNCEALMNAN